MLVEITCHILFVHFVYGKQKRMFFFFLFCGNKISMNIFFLCFRRNNVQCLNGIISTGDYFIVVLFVEYPQGCRTSYCTTQYLKMIRNNIDTQYYKIHLRITLANGQVLDITVTFCSYDPPPTGKTLSHLFKIRFIEIIFFC